MKIMAIVLITMMFLMGCGSDKVINGVEYETYGLLNQDDVKSPYIKYKPIWGNIIWGSLLFGTIIAPIYFFGFSMFEPVKVKLTIEKLATKGG